MHAALEPATENMHFRCQLSHACKVNELSRIWLECRQGHVDWHGAKTRVAIRKLLSGLYEGVGFLTEAGIRLWLRLFGKKVRKADVPWLKSPVGPGQRIGAEFYRLLAEREGLVVRCCHPDAGLVTNFDALKGPDFDPSCVKPEIRHFYEHTAGYRLDTWTEAALPTRFFLWFLITFVSRRMGQLNFPISSLETSRGMTSEIVQLAEPLTGRIAYTGWLRTLAGSGRVIYAGFYSDEQPGVFPSRCVKVTFPVPSGSATVFLRPAVEPDGSFKLISAGSRFGEPGFYRLLEIDDDHWKVRYLRTLHEVFHVYVDHEGALRTDHTIRFLGLTVLRLHYRLTRA